MALRITITALLTSVATAITLAGCEDNTPPVSSGNGVQVIIPSGAVGLGAHAYGANPLAIAVGTTVTWLNQDSLAHTATADDGTWDTGPIQPGKTFEFNFSSSGTHSYHCVIHGAGAESGAIQVQ